MEDLPPEMKDWEMIDDMSSAFDAQIPDELKTSSIGICGKMFSGKSTLAKKMNSFYGHEVVSVADPVKEFAIEVCGMDSVRKDRDLLQKIGDGARNIIGPEVWIDSLTRRIKGRKDEGMPSNTSSDEKRKLFICDDVRYDNEALALRRMGWKIVKVYAEDDVRKNRMVKKCPTDWDEHWSRRDHHSESEVDNIYYDYLFQNGIWMD